MVERLLTHINNQAASKSKEARMTRALSMHSYLLAIPAIVIVFVLGVTSAILDIAPLILYFFAVSFSSAFAFARFSLTPTNLASDLASLNRR